MGSTAQFSLVQIESVVSHGLKASAQKPLISSEASKLWDFPGWIPLSSLDQVKPNKRVHLDSAEKHSTINHFAATSIAGNDLMASILYTMGITVGLSGQLAPLCLFLVGIVLALFRRIYSEACTVVPLNGGSYSILLNATSQRVASLAASLTLLSYTVTAVVSAREAAAYVADTMDTVHGRSSYWWTIGILMFFAATMLFGMKESSVVASVIFTLHMISLMALCIIGSIYGAQHPKIMVDNFSEPLPYHWTTSVFLGFSAAMLGITGFETCANYIEQQGSTTFLKTLRSMWYCVFILNPLTAMVVLSVLPIASINANYKDAIAKTAYFSGGKYFGYWMSFDAALVLGGSVLTSFVGVTGLVRRLSLDHSLPRVFLHTNSWRGSDDVTIMTFTAVCVSLYIMVSGDVQSLAHVFTIAFLSVMFLFAAGNMMLKYKRPRLRRRISAPWWMCVVAAIAVVAALVGNIYVAPLNLVYFMFYFVVIAGPVYLMFERSRLLRFLLYFLSQAPTELSHKIVPYVERLLHKVKYHRFTVFFSKNADLALLTKATVYVQNNELGYWMKIVHCHDDPESPELRELAAAVATLSECYPKRRFDLVFAHAPFNPETLESISQRLRIGKNFMFIASPGGNFPHGFGELGAVRIITH